MKAILILALLLTSITTLAQVEPKNIDNRPINLRLQLASEELNKSADYGDLAIYTVLVGGAMTAIACTESERSAWIVGGITLFGTYTLTLKSSGHKRRAGKALHQ